MKERWNIAKECAEKEFREEEKKEKEKEKENMSKTETDKEFKVERSGHGKRKKSRSSVTPMDSIVEEKEASSDGWGTPQPSNISEHHDVEDPLTPVRVENDDDDDDSVDVRMCQEPEKECLLINLRDS